MKNITFIIPVFHLNEEENKKLFTDAVKSIGKDSLIVAVGAKEDLDLITNKKVKKVENTTGNLSYPKQVMLGVENVETEYFSVVEQDDKVNEAWYNYLTEYMERDVDGIFAYLPLTEVIDYASHETIGYANEAFWASSFSEEIGFLDMAAMEDYLNFNTSGAVFKTKEFLSLGGLKTSMKLTFWYEFILRALYKEKKMFVVPRIGYFHLINRKGNLTDIYSSTLSEKEAEWWIELAKKEFYFPQDRNKVYEEE